METVTDFIFLGSKITVNGDSSHEIKTLVPRKESYDKPRQHITKWRYPYSQSSSFSSSHVWMWKLDHKEGWVPKNLCFWTVVLEKTLESLLDCKEIQPVHSKGNQSWIPWKDWCWSWNSNTLATSCEELTHWKRLWCWKGMGAGGEGTTEDEMAGWHQQLDGHESE